jgi:hypothetical protein
MPNGGATVGLAVVSALVAVVLALVAVFRAAVTLAAVALIAMVAVIPAAHAVSVGAGRTIPAADVLTTTTTTTTITTTTTASAPAAPPESTTTTATAATTATTAIVRPPASPPTTTSTTGRPASAVAPSRLQQVEAIADGSGWNWHGAGTVIHVAFHPQECCHWGVYDYRDSSLWIGPTAFASPTRLRYVVLHELGHAWQWHSGHLDSLAADMAPWGHAGTGGLEAGADCISVVWGASPGAGHYWSCPASAAALVARRLAGDWR